jgi:hypothetical protein
VGGYGLRLPTEVNHGSEPHRFRRTYLGGNPEVPRVSGWLSLRSKQEGARRLILHTRSRVGTSMRAGSDLRYRDSHALVLVGTRCYRPGLGPDWAQQTYPNH